MKAYCHIGVLREMEKADIKPDFIAANSVGAIIGILYAAGFSPDDIEKIIQTIDLPVLLNLSRMKNSNIPVITYLEDVITSLFPESKFDIKNTLIPIITPTDDPFTNRKIVYAEGNITDVIRANLKMSFWMDPVNLHIDDSTNMHIEDFGNLDIWTLNIAEGFSKNLIISTSSVNLPAGSKDNIAVISNSFSTENEKLLMHKLAASKYYWIRSDLSKLLDSDINNTQSLIKAGEESSNAYFQSHKDIKSESFTDFLYYRPDFKTLRNLRHQYADHACSFIEQEKAFYKKYNYNNILTADVYKGMELKDFFFSEKLSTGLYTFFDFRPLYISTGIRTNFFTFWAPDESILPEIKTTLLSELNSFSDMNSSFSKIQEQKIILGLENKRDFYIKGMIHIKPYLTCEMKTLLEKFDFESSTYLARAGANFYNNFRNIINYSVNPYAYYYNNALFSDIINHLGLGGQFYADITAIPYVGFKVADAYRYQKYGYGIVLYQNDDYRGKSHVKLNESYNSNYLNLFKMELFWYLRNLKSSFDGNIQLGKIKAGLYFDLLSFKDNNEFTSGVFIRPHVIINKSSHINMEAYAGYDSISRTPVVGFSFTEKW